MTRMARPPQPLRVSASTSSGSIGSGLGGAGTAAIIVALCAIFASGCGASALERHTMAASIFHEANTAAAEYIEAEATAAVDAATTEAEVEAAIERRRPVQAAQHLFAATLDGYVTAILIAARAESPDMGDVRAAGLRLLDVYEQLRRLTHEIGVDLPSVTRYVLPLLGGGE